jgi:hypothetical protein
MGQTPPPVISEFDPGFAVGLDLTRRIRVDVYTGREKTDELSTSKWKIGGGVSFRTKALFHFLADEADSDKQHVLVIGENYEYSSASEAGVRVTEQKLMTDATGRWAIAHSFLLSDRSRFEFRWIDGNEYRFRFRNRLRFERTLRPGRFKLTPYFAAEAFWDKHYGSWNQFRYTAGSEIRLFRRTSLDLYFERSHCSTCSYPNTNIVGATIFMFFKRNK